MISMRATLIGLALLAGGATTASAADLGGMRDDDTPVSAGSARYYLRGDIGYDFNRAPSMDQDGTSFSTTSFGNSWNYGGGIGWYLSPNWRMDVTAEHHQDASASGSIASTHWAGDENFDVSSTVVLANVYYDFTGRAGFNPYLGAGIGWAQTHTHGGIATDVCACGNTIDSASQDNFAWALMAGFTRELDRGFSLDAGYRLLDVGGTHTGNMVDKLGHATTYDSSISTGNIYANEIRIGLRYDLN